MTSKIIIYAPNIHTGGGAVLLRGVINSLGTLSRPIIFFCDERFFAETHPPNFYSAYRVRPTILNRFFGELKLRKLAKGGDIVLCMGNLPPIFQLHGETILFLQNRYLVDKVSLSGFKLIVRARIFVERIWLKIWSLNVDHYIVQTPSMKRLLQNRIGESYNISIKPFLSEVYDYRRHLDDSNRSRGVAYDFIYVASGEAHKNHRRLIEAWMLLAKDGYFPSLCITVDRAHFPMLCNWIKSSSEEFKLNVSNLGGVPHREMLYLYKKCGAAIYPSIFESFGIPLVEARRVGIPILASELDYVRDLLDPEESFDPNSALSIARSVKRFLSLSEHRSEIINAYQFIDFLIECRAS